MADDHDRTVLEFEADASKVQALGEEINKAMDARPLERMEEQAKDLDTAFGDLVDKQAELTKGLLGVEKGTDAYRALKDELRGVAEEARLTESALKGVAKRIGAADSGGGGGGGGGGEVWQEGGTQHMRSVQKAMQTQHARKKAAGAGDDDAGGTGKTLSFARGAQSAIMGGAAAFSGAPLSSALDTGAGAVAASGAGMGGTFAVLSIPIAIDMMLAAMAMRAAESIYPSGMAWAGARMQARPHVRSLSIGDDGAAFGMDVTQTLGAAAGLGRSIGAPVTSKQLRAALAMQQLGIDQGTTGGLFRVYQPGRGASGDPMQALARMYSQATAAGISGASRSEYMAHIVNTIQGAGQGGATIDVGSLLTLEDRLGGSGFSSVHGARVAGGMARGAMGVGRSGPQDAIGVAMLRAAGYRGGGAESYAEATLQMQRDPAGVASKALERIMGGLPGGDSQRAMFLQRVLGSSAFGGVQIGPDQAMILAQGLSSGRGGTMSTINELIEQGAAQAVDAGMGLPQQAARLGSQRARVGAKIAPTMLTLAEAQTNLAEAAVQLSPAFLQLAKMARGTTGALRDFMVWLKKHTKGNGGGPPKPDPPKPDKPYEVGGDNETWIPSGDAWWHPDGRPGG